MPRALALALSVPLAAQLACGPLLVLITPDGAAVRRRREPAGGAGRADRDDRRARRLPDRAAPVAAVRAHRDRLAAGGVDRRNRADHQLRCRAIRCRGSRAGRALPLSPPSSLAIGAVIVVPRLRGRPIAKPQTVRAAAVLLLAVVAGIVAGGAALASVAGRWTLPADWSILACDVGQGDAVLLRSAGAIALIDTGPDPEPLERVPVARRASTTSTCSCSRTSTSTTSAGVDAVVGRVGHRAARTAGHSLRTLACSTRLDDGGARTLQAHTGTTGTLGRVDVARAVAAGRQRARIRRATTRSVVARRPRRRDADIAVPRRPLRVAAGRSGGIRRTRAAVRPREGRPSRQRRPGRRGCTNWPRPAIALVTVGADNDYGHPRDGDAGDRSRRSARGSRAPTSRA